MDPVPGVLDAQAEKPVSAGPPADAPAGDPTFQRILEEAARGEAAPAPSAPAAAIERVKTLNLLNGQFPPPDSGAGYLSITVALQNEPDS